MARDNAPTRQPAREKWMLREPPQPGPADAISCRPSPSVFLHGPARGCYTSVLFCEPWTVFGPVLYG